MHSMASESADEGGSRRLREAIDSASLIAWKSSLNLYTIVMRPYFRLFSNRFSERAEKLRRQRRKNKQKIVMWLSLD